MAGKRGVEHVNVKRINTHRPCPCWAETQTSSVYLVWKKESWMALTELFLAIPQALPRATNVPETFVVIQQQGQASSICLAGC
jgi:hypothetical protein